MHEYAASPQAHAQERAPHLVCHPLSDFVRKYESFPMHVCVRCILEYVYMYIDVYIYIYIYVYMYICI